MNDTKEKNKNEYDAIIIGSSLGGLATSFVRGRFEFEATLHELESVGTEKNPRNIRKFLDEAGVSIDWLQVPEAYRIILPNDKINAVMPYGIENMIEAVEKEVPGTREKMTKFMKVCKEVVESINYFTELGGVEKLSKLELLKNHSSFVKTAGYSAKEVIDTFQLPDRALKLISPYWIYVGVPLKRLSFTVFAYLLGDYFEGGAVVCKNNSHALSLAMEKRQEELGGTTLFNSRVSKILVKEGRVYGVRTENGMVYKAPYVICAAYPNKVYTEMIEPIEEVPKEAIKLVNARSVGVSAFTVYLALDVPYEELNIDSYSYFVGETMDTDEIWENYKTINPPKYVTAIVLNLANNKCFPEGTTEMSITALPKAEGWMNIKKEDYIDIKNAYAKAMIDMMNKVLNVNLYKHIEEIEIASPCTISRYTGSWNGSVYGYEHQTWDSVVARLTEEKKESFIGGLEFIGAHSSVGNGYAPNITSGIKAAVSILKDGEERGARHEG